MSSLMKLYIYRVSESNVSNLNLLLKNISDVGWSYLMNMTAGILKIGNIVFFCWWYDAPDYCEQTKGNMTILQKSLLQRCYLTLKMNMIFSSGSFFSEKATFDVSNKVSCRIWSSENSHAIHQVEWNSLKVNVICTRGSAGMFY